MAHIVEYILRLGDKMSGSMANIARAAGNLDARIRRLQTQTGNATTSINSLNEKIRRLHEQRNNSTAIDQIRRLNGEIRRLEQQASRLENMPPPGFINSIRYAQGGMGAMLKTAIKGYGAMQAWGAIKGFAQLGLDMEQTRAKFEVLLGSVEKGNEMIAAIGELAKSTPLDKGGLVSNAETLLAFNLAGEKIVPTLKMLGDVAMGDKTKMQGLTLAYAQMMSTGKLMGQDLLQMINQGFNPLVEMSKMTGKSLEQLKDAMSKGAISAKMVEDAFRHATSEGGQFYGMMEKMSQTGAGKLTQAIGAMRDRLIEYSEKFTPFIGKMIDFTMGLISSLKPVVTLIETLAIGTITLVKWLNDNRGVLVALISAYAAYRFAVWSSTLATTGWTVASKLQYYWLLMCERAQKILNAALLKNPFTIALVGITLLVGALVRMRKKTDESTEAMKRAKETAEGYYAQEKSNLDVIFAKLKQTNPKSKERNQLVDELKRMYPDLNAQIEKELRNTNNLTAAYDSLIAKTKTRTQIKAYEQALEPLQSGIMKKEEAIKAEIKKKYPAYANASEEELDTVFEMVKGTVTGVYRSSYKKGYRARAGTGDVLIDVGNMKAFKEYRKLVSTTEYLLKKIAGLTLADIGKSGGGSGSGNSTLADPASTISGLTGGGARETNIHINFRNLIENLKMYPQTLREGIDETTDALTEGLLRVVNSANRAAQ